MNHTPKTNVQSIRNQFEKKVENSKPKFVLQRSVTTIGPFACSEKCKKSNETITRKPTNFQRSSTSINLLTKETKCCNNNNEGYSKPNLLSRQLSDPVKRGNIKRTPAFRCDKSLEEGAAGAVFTNNASRLNLTNKIRMFEKCQSNNKEPNEPKFRYPLKKTINKDSTISNSPTKYKTNQVLKRELDLILERRKQFPNTKLVFNESTNNYSSGELLKPTPQCSFNQEYAQINKNNKKLSTRIPSPVTRIPSIDNLTDTLKKALQSPLPDGPPPKKPPRTFAHKSPNLQKNVPNLVPKPFSSRNDPVRMLDKLENALLQNRIKSPMTRRKVLDMENIKSTNVTKTDNIVEAHNNKLFECFSPCNTNEYAEPICSRSNFFVDSNILHRNQIKSRTKTPTSSLDRRKAEHVYDEPFAMCKNLPDMTKTQRALELNLNDGKKM